MSRITRPSKGFAIVGALMIGFLPGAAHAKWIKATVSGLLESGSADGLAAVGGDVSLDFVIQNYTRTSGSTDTTNQWKQTIAKSNYTQLFNYGTGANSTGLGLNGNYDASTTPQGPGAIFQSSNNGSDFLMLVSGTPSSGLYITDSGTRVNIKSIKVSGAISDFASTVPASLDIVDFLSASGATGEKSCNAPDYCGKGEIERASGGKIEFKWTKVKFQEMQAVPGPLPLTGLLAAFRLSRKIRTRIKSS